MLTAKKIDDTVDYEGDFTSQRVCSFKRDNYDIVIGESWLHASFVLQSGIEYLNFMAKDPNVYWEHLLSHNCK